jgi:hypothetical protein
MMTTRRRFILICATSLVLGFGAAPALAEDGGDDGGGDDGGSGGGSGSGGSGSGSNGSGGGNGGSGGSGSGSGDDGSDNDGDDDSGNGSGSKNGKGKAKDQDRAQDAVAAGKAAPLLKLKEFLKQNYPGKILKIDLNKRFGSYVYKVRILQAGNRVKSMTLDALTLQSKLF